MNREVTNLVLVGMPGSGKTSVGRELARRMGRAFLDTDTMVEEKTGRKIPDIILQDGEAAFRALEREAVREAGSVGGRIVATGGGAVLDPENYPPLAQNGRLYFLRRDISRLPTDGRPLSRKLEEMYAGRLPLYRRFADAEVDCNGSISATAEIIGREFYETAGA
jgi:shikimate dehydrogenase